MNRRTAIVAHAVERITRVFDPPRGITEDQRTARLSAMAEAIQYAIPSYANAEQVQEAVDKGLRDLTFGARSQTWPIPNAIIEAVRKHAPEPPRRSVEQTKIRGAARCRSTPPFDAETRAAAHRIAEAVRNCEPINQRDFYAPHWICAAHEQLVTSEQVGAWAVAMHALPPLSVAEREALGWPLAEGA